MDSKTFIAHGVSEMGIYPYPGIIIPVERIFNSQATKDDIDYIDKITKPGNLKLKMAKLYDEYQERFKLKEVR